MKNLSFLPSFLLVGLFLALVQVPKIQAQIDCGMDIPKHSLKALPNGSDCDVDLSNVPVKKIRLVYHVFQKDDGSDNIQDDPAGQAFIGEIHNRLSGYRTLDPVTLGYTGAYVSM